LPLSFRAGRAESVRAIGVTVGNAAAFPDVLTIDSVIPVQIRIRYGICPGSNAAESVN
jgi:hypothetical protein